MKRETGRGTTGRGTTGQGTTARAADAETSASDPANADPADAETTAHAAVAEFFKGVPLGRDVYEVVCGCLAELGPFEVRVTRSQVAFRRRRGFAWLWRPDRWLRKPAADVVVSFALREPVSSPRLKQVVQASPRTWMHHLEVRDAVELDAEVARWLGQAWEEAA